MEGIRSFFLIFPISIAFKIELVSCRYLGVAANSSTRIQSNMLRCFMMKPEYSKLAGDASNLPPIRSNGLDPLLHIFRLQSGRPNQKERTSTYHNNRTF